MRLHHNHHHRRRLQVPVVHHPREKAITQSDCDVPLEQEVDNAAAVVVVVVVEEEEDAEEDDDTKISINPAI